MELLSCSQVCDSPPGEMVLQLPYKAQLEQVCIRLEDSMPDRAASLQSSKDAERIQENETVLATSGTISVLVGEDLLRRETFLHLKKKPVLPETIGHDIAFVPPESTPIVSTGYVVVCGLKSDSSLIRVFGCMLPPASKRRRYSLCSSSSALQEDAKQFFGQWARENKPIWDLVAPLLLQLYQQIVVDGDFQGAERTVMNGDLPKKQLSISVEWKRIYWENPQCESYMSLVPSDHKEVWPSARAGHQLLIDSASNSLYMFGGWNGITELGDFWRFDLGTRQWILIDEDCRQRGGPSPRSCHKMVLDERKRRIYLLGKFYDGPIGDDGAELWCFDISVQRWSLLCSDTSINGGPSVIYDHTMVIDPVERKLYVFGGRTVHNWRRNLCIYSGFYVFDLRTGRWTCLRNDIDASMADGITNPLGRMGHSMLLHPYRREIYILAGQRRRLLLSDMWRYCIESDTLELMATDTGGVGGPCKHFTQRATLNLVHDEICVMSGLKVDGDRTKVCVSSSVWIYSIADNTWTQVFGNENVNGNYWSTQQFHEPRPRFAHQMVFDPSANAFWVFGGNPESNPVENPRLNDMWRLTLKRPRPSATVELQILHIRMQRYRELCWHGDTDNALKYLQEAVRSTVSEPSDDVNDMIRNAAVLAIVPPRIEAQDEFKERIRICRRQVLSSIIAHLQTK